MSNCVLIIDDEIEVARALKKSLLRRDPNLEIDQKNNHQDAILFIKKNKPEIIILDLTIDISKGPISGLTLLEEILETDPTSRVIVLTGHSKNEKGMDALNRGAFTYLEKPGNPDVILSFIKDSFEVVNLKRSSLKKESLNHYFCKELNMTSSSEVMKNVLDQISFAVKTNQPVLITGETGTGKGLLARLIHKNSSRKNSPFIRYQASFTNPDLVASELYGHKKGSFTGAAEDRKGLIEEANQGSLFIDEIDAIPKETQVSLLETLQEKTFRKIGSTKEQLSNFRLIAALNKDPKVVLENGDLRLDFYHRIAHTVIELPPLRNRKEDIGDLAQSFIDNLAEKENLDIAFIDEAALSKIRKYSWPGNIRELQATIEGAAYRASIHGRKYITLEDIHLKLGSNQILSDEAKSFRERIKIFEEQIIHDALRETQGNQALAAKNLQMDRTVFRRILQRINS